MKNVRHWIVISLLLAVIGALGVDHPGGDLHDNLVRTISLQYPPAPSRPILTFHCCRHGDRAILCTVRLGAKSLNVTLTNNKYFLHP